MQTYKHIPRYPSALNVKQSTWEKRIIIIVGTCFVRNRFSLLTRWIIQCMYWMKLIENYNGNNLFYAEYGGLWGKTIKGRFCFQVQSIRFCRRGLTYALQYKRNRMRTHHTRFDGHQMFKLNVYRKRAGRFRSECSTVCYPNLSALAFRMQFIPGTRRSLKIHRYSCTDETRLLRSRRDVFLWVQTIYNFFPENRINFTTPKAWPPGTM